MSVGQMSVWGAFRSLPTGGALSSSSLWTLNSGFGCDSEETPQDTLEAGSKWEWREEGGERAAPAGLLKGCGHSHFPGGIAWLQGARQGLLFLTVSGACGAQESAWGRGPGPAGRSRTCRNHCRAG